MNISQWCYVLDCLGTRRTKSEISRIIKKNCLVSEKQVWGAYLVDDELGWKYLIETEQVCLETAKKHRLENWKDIEPYYEERKSHEVWHSTKVAYSRFKR